MIFVRESREVFLKQKSHCVVLLKCSHVEAEGGVHKWFILTVKLLLKLAIGGQGQQGWYCCYLQCISSCFPNETCLIFSLEKELAFRLMEEMTRRFSAKYKTLSRVPSLRRSRVYPLYSGYILPASISCIMKPTRYNSFRQKRTEETSSFFLTSFTRCRSICHQYNKYFYLYYA